MYFVIVDAATEELLGAIDVRRPDREDSRIGEIGYLLVAGAGARGRGVMTRALRLVAAGRSGRPWRWPGSRR